MYFHVLMLGPLGTNCYVLTSDALPGHAVLIDPAGNPGIVSDYLDKAGLTLDAMLLTHTHFDHMAAVDELAARYGAPLYCSEKDAPGLTDPVLNGSALMLTRKPLIVKTQPERLLKDGDKVLVCKEELTVLETPGHTVGSVCFLTDSLLFSGDTLFCYGYGRTDLPGGSAQTLKNSLRKLLLLDDRTVCPGHDEQTTIANERRYYGL